MVFLAWIMSINDFFTSYASFNLLSLNIYLPTSLLWNLIILYRILISNHTSKSTTSIPQKSSLFLFPWWHAIERCLRFGMGTWFLDINFCGQFYLFIVFLHLIVYSVHPHPDPVFSLPLHKQIDIGRIWTFEA